MVEIPKKSESTKIRAKFYFTIRACEYFLHNWWYQKYVAIDIFYYQTWIVENLQSHHTRFLGVPKSFTIDTKKEVNLYVQGGALIPKLKIKITCGLKSFVLDRGIFMYL